jgi:hypothetical protein
VEERLLQRLGVAAKVLGRELDDQRERIANSPGGVRKALVVSDSAVRNFAIEELIVQTCEEQLKIGFRRQHE